MPSLPVHVFTQRPTWRLWVTRPCDVPQLATRLARVGYHCVCDRLHCVHSSGLIGSFTHGEMGCRLGSFNRIVAHVISRRAGPLCFRSYVEHQAGSRSEGDPGRASTSMSV